MGGKGQFTQQKVYVSDVTSQSEPAGDIGREPCTWKKSEHLLAAVDVAMENTMGSRDYRAIIRPAVKVSRNAHWKGLLL